MYSSRYDADMLVSMLDQYHHNTLKSDMFADPQTRQELEGYI
jgi:hypothetical protein